MVMKKTTRSDLAGQPVESLRRRLKKPVYTVLLSKVSNFFGRKKGEPFEVILEMLLPETTSIAQVHSKFLIEEWQNHITSCEVEDLLANKNACVACVLSIGTATKDFFWSLH